MAAVQRRKSQSNCQIEFLLEELISSTDEITKDDIKQKIKQCYRIAFAQNSFLENYCPQESAMQKIIVEKTLEDPITSPKIGMLSGHLVGQFLKLVAEMVKARNILDIGTYTGYSAISFAETSQCEKVTTLDINEDVREFVTQGIKGTPLEQKINIMIGPALDSLKELQRQGESFDLVFIDADKCSYIDYYKFIMENKLLNSNGVILCDNIMWGNDTILERKTIQGEALYELVEMVKKDDQVDQMIFPFRDGVMLIRLKS